MIGIDIVEIDRLANKAQEIAEYILSNEEYEEYKTKRKNALSYLAGRFAAKEALVKAMSDQTIVFKEVSVLSDQNGKPVLTYRDIKASVSISHEQHYAVAVVLIES